MTPDERTAANRQNRAIVQHLVSCRETGKPYCTTKELFECFGPDRSDDDDFLRFQKKLVYLASKDAIENTSCGKPTRGKPARWAPGPRAQAYCHTASGCTQLTVEKPPKPEPLPKWIGPIVPPRCVDVMHGPTYVPTHAASTRAGADDYRACPSVGVRC